MGATLLHASMVVPPAAADLTPAIDKFERLPLAPFQDPLFMTAKGPAPEGPDPFKYVADELNPLSDFVKDLMVSENPVLTMAASHFFDQVSQTKHPMGVNRRIESLELTFCREEHIFTSCFDWFSFY